MVKANELRVGNWVRFGEQCNGVITEIMASGCTYDCDHHICGHQEWSLISPIPLTPEILEQCGFIPDEVWGFKHPILKCRWVTMNLIGDPTRQPFLRFDSIKKPHPTCTDITYLHQLQNLYFAMTGEELVYQPIKELT